MDDYGVTGLARAWQRLKELVRKARQRFWEGHLAASRYCYHIIDPDGGVEWLCYADVASNVDLRAFDPLC